jgi:hypothetical protein
MQTKYSAKQSQRLSGNHQGRNDLHRHQKFDTPEKIPDAESGTKPKRPRFGRNYELEDITRKDISLPDQLYSQFRNTVMNTGKLVEGANFETVPAMVI